MVKPKANLESHFKGESKVIISAENQSLVDSYLGQVRKRSDGSYRNQKSALTEFFNYIDKPIAEINMIDVKNYFDEVIDKKDIKLDSKNGARSYLNSFFCHVQSLLLSKNQIINNPVPSKKIYQFTQLTTDVSMVSDEQCEVLTKEQLNQIMDYCKKNLKRKHFIMYSMFIFSGSRPAETLTVKIKDINITERFFETGFEKNARKSTLKTKKSLVFFIPKGFVPYLQNYILTLKPNQKYLFQVGEDHPKRETIEYIEKKVKKGVGFKFQLKWFRKSLITNYTLNGCPDGIREGLMNHASRSIEWKHYIKLNIEQKRAIFDKYFPYYDLPYF